MDTQIDSFLDHFKRSAARSVDDHQHTNTSNANRVKRSYSSGSRILCDLEPSLTAQGR